MREYSDFPVQREQGKAWWYGIFAEATPLIRELRKGRKSPIRIPGPVNLGGANPGSEHPDNCKLTTSKTGVVTCQ